MDDRTLSMVAAGLRVGIGSALVIAPGFAGLIWVGPDADGPGSKVFARAIGARDVVLGYRTFRAAQNNEDIGGWLQIGALSDMADTVAACVAIPTFSHRRKFAMPAISGAVGVAHYLLARRQAGTADTAAAESTPA